MYNVQSSDVGTTEFTLNIHLPDGIRTDTFSVIVPSDACVLTSYTADRLNIQATEYYLLYDPTKILPFDFVQ